MNNFSPYTTFLLLAVVLLAGCAKVQPNFLINGLDTPSIDDPRIDSVEVVSALVGVPVSFSENSTPLGEVQEVLWDFDGDGEWDQGPLDAFDITHVFETSGLKHVRMCANGEEENIITKQIQIKDKVTIKIEPELSFTSPPSSFESSSQSNYDIAIHTTNILSPDELSLYVNEIAQEFEFNGALGELTAKIDLQEGENRIEVQAQIDGQDDTYSKLAYLVYEKTKAKSRKEVAPKEKKKEKKEEKVEKKKEDPCSLDKGMSATGYPSKKISEACAIQLGTEYAMELTPKKCVELYSMRVFTEQCGQMMIKLEWDGGSEEISVALNGGVSQCSLFGLGIVLQPDVTYTLSLKTKTGGSCSATQAPMLYELQGCEGKAISSKEIQMNYKGKQVILDLEYAY